eukprot:COSAG02_NODE_8740_length_2458_cov_6.377279_2_plen_170_part_00
MGYQQLLPIVVEKTAKLSGLDWENQCILNAQSEIGFFPAGEHPLYTLVATEIVIAPGRANMLSCLRHAPHSEFDPSKNHSQEACDNLKKAYPKARHMCLASMTFDANHQPVKLFLGVHGAAVRATLRSIPARCQPSPPMLPRPTRRSSLESSLCNLHSGRTEWPQVPRG